MSAATPRVPQGEQLNPARYELDSDDGLLREIVGAWVVDKYARLRKYVGISRSVRSKFVGAAKAGATFIDLFSGPGRVRIRDERSAMDGGPLVAWRESAAGKGAFTKVYVSDASSTLASAAASRLSNAGAPLAVDAGSAAEVVDRLIPKLNRAALHFAFLDPYNLKALPFEVIRKLASVERMDILVHVSLQDLQRNLKTYLRQSASPLDSFAPDWRDKIGPIRSEEIVRGKIFEHWRSLLKAEGMSTTETAELVVGPNQQHLYWLAFSARHERALEFWEKVRSLKPTTQMKLL